MTAAQARETLQWIADRRAYRAACQIKPTRPTAWEEAAAERDARRTLSDALRITADTFYAQIAH